MLLEVRLSGRCNLSPSDVETINLMPSLEGSTLARCVPSVKFVIDGMADLAPAFSSIS